MKDFLQALAKRLKKNTTAYENYHRIYVRDGHLLKCAPKEPLRVNVLFQHIQKMLSSDTAVIRGSIATRMWVTAQDVSTMRRCGQNSIIFLLNNGDYTTEVEIHDRPYNVIKNWNYTALVYAIHNGAGKCWTTKVCCEEDLIEAIENTTGANKDCLCFIEVMAHRDDTSKELLKFGSRVAAANSRPPNPQ